MAKTLANFMGVVGLPLRGRSCHMYLDPELLYPVNLSQGTEKHIAADKSASNTARWGSAGLTVIC